MRISNPPLGSRMRFVLGMLAGALALLGAAQGSERGLIQGVVRDLDGAPLPGARISAVSAPDAVVRRASVSVHTAEDGTYALHPEPGTFNVRAELAGFCGGEQPRLRVGSGAARTVDFTLQLSPVTEVLWIARSLAELVAHADVVVHLRIVRSHLARLLVPDILCGDGNVFTEHELAVVAAIKTDHAAWPDAERVIFVQNRAGVYTDGQTTVTGPEAPYAVGEEYVAFLRWIPARQRFVSSAAPNLVVPVRDGRITWVGGGEEGVRDGMPVRAFIDHLRSLRD